MKTPTLLLLLLALTTLLGGCASLLVTAGHEQVYVLTPASLEPSSAPPPVAVPVTLAVEVPESFGLTDSTSLLISPVANQLQVYADARWAERPAQLLQRQLLAALITHGVTRAIPAGSSVLSTVRLESNLDDFRVIARGLSNQVRIVMRVRLVDNRSRRLLGQRRFAIEQAAAGPQAGNVVRAFSRATQHLVNQVAVWTTAQLQHPAPPTTD